MWSHLLKKCDCEEDPTNPGTVCDHNGLTTDDVIYLGASLNCLNIPGNVTVSEALQILNEYVCSPAFTGFLLDLIQINPGEYESFIAFINSIINCETINNCN